MRACGFGGLLAERGGEISDVEAERRQLGDELGEAHEGAALPGRAIVVISWFHS